jgi:hypothetical protein
MFSSLLRRKLPRSFLISDLRFELQQEKIRRSRRLFELLEIVDSVPRILRVLNRDTCPPIAILTSVPRRHFLLVAITIKLRDLSYF